MLSLVDPDARYHASWLDAQAEFAEAGEYQHGSGLTRDGESPEGRPCWYAADLADPARFAAFVEFSRALRDPAYGRPYGYVADTKRWAIDDGRYVGVCSLRHSLNDFLLELGGHIGYSVRPSARRRGVASWMLGEAVAEARALGIERVLVTCAEGNSASAGVIEKAGGVLEDTRQGYRRFWIDTGAAAR